MNRTENRIIQSVFLKKFKSSKMQALPSEDNLYDLYTENTLTHQEENESNVRSYPRRIPISIKNASGIMVQDTRGYKFIDCLAGAGALPLGHNNPEINEEIKSHIDSGLPFQTLDITTPVKDQFMTELLNFLPPAFAKGASIQFCGPSGADAVEAALKLVKIKTGRSGIIAFHGAYHGMTHGALSITGNINIKERIPGLMSNVQFFPYPYSLRCPFGIGGDGGAKMANRYLESVLCDPESGVVKPAAVIVESIQGEGGVIAAPDSWLQELRRITKEHDIALIIDEIQTGVGRTGKNFAFEHAGITPDIVLLSKAIGGGLPLSLIVFNKSFDCWKPGEHAGTFRGNQLALVAGLKTMQIIKRDNLTKHADEMGTLLKNKLKAIQAKNDCIAEVRGKGLMIGIEIIKAGKTDKMGHPEADSTKALEIQYAALQRGLILEIGGRNGSILRLLPPLTINEQQVEVIASIITRSII